MKKIHLGGKYGSAIGNYALVDDADFDWLNQWKWTAMNNGNTIYARRDVLVNGKNAAILMHRAILGITDRKTQGDHIDGNGLNNQRYNVRVCTQKQNNRNRGASSAQCTSKFKGVCFHSRDKIWVAKISVDNIAMHLGYHKTEIAAALAYNEAATLYYGEFAKLNIL